MPHPLMREPAAADEAEDYQADLSSEETNAEWPDGEAYVPLAYVDADDQAAVEADPDELEATMMSNLEAVASAFWVETGPELAPLDDSDEPRAAHAWPVAPSLDPEDETWDFRDARKDDLIGPRRGALLDFRPPGARRERPVRADRNDLPVKERRPAKGGAFADDLAARNKEFYELLRAPAAAPRKIAAAPEAPAVRPGFRSFFAGEPDAGRAPFVPAQAPAKSSFRRYAVALGVIVLVVGAGVTTITTRSDGLVAPVGAVTAAAPAEEEPAPIQAVKDAASRAPSEAVPKIVKTERVTVTDFDAAPAVPPVDPGTLVTPPLYESESAAAAAQPSAKTSPLASLDLRPTNTGAPSASEAKTGTTGAETVKAKATDPVPEVGATANEPIAADAAPAAQKPELPAKAKQPAPKKVASADSKPATSKPQRAATGSAIVNQAVKMRSGPDNDASVVKVVPTGARVDVVGCKGWCEVIAGGDRGYIFQRFLNRGSGPRASSDAPKAEVVKASSGANDHEPFDLLRFVNPGN